jgi:mono/diheme cytochrome c family protein
MFCNKLIGMNKLGPKNYLPFILIALGAILLLAGIWLLLFSKDSTTEQAARTPLAGVTAEQGKQTFREYCNMCHPVNGTYAGNGPKLAGTRVTSNYEFLYNQVRNGRGLMPPFKPETLTELQISAIYQYLNTLK